MTVVHTGGNSSILNLSFAPSPEPNREQLTERKYCEGGCGGCFWRTVPKTAREGEKLCERCKAREDRAKETATRRRLELIGRVRKFPVMGEGVPAEAASARQRSR